MHNPFSATAENETGWFLTRHGMLYRSGRLVLQLPRVLRLPVRLVSWVYWDIWWPSRVSWRLTTNQRTLYLVALFVASAAIILSRRAG